MTREEAIDVLKRNYPSSCFEDLCKAVDIAIKALEEPEIIRCKECKYSDRWLNERRCFLGHETGMCVFDEGYCNYAKRKNNG